MTRSLLKTAVLALLATIATVATAACGGDDDPNVVVIGPNEPVQIRTLLSGTGASRAAVEMAVGDFGLIHGHEVELGAPVDAMCSREGGHEGADEIVDDPLVLGIVGTSCSVAAVAASPTVSVAGLVMISPSNTSPVLTSDLRGNAGGSYHPGYFRVANNDLYQGQAVAGFAYDELGLRRMVALHDGDPYTSALATAFREEFRARGGRVPTIGVIEKGQTDMRDVLREFTIAEPDGIFFPIFSAEAEHFMRQARESNRLRDATFISADGALGAEFLALPESEGLYFAGPPTHEGSNFNNATGRTADEALAAFETDYSEFAHLTPFWAHAYDAATLLLAAIERAAVRDDGNFLTRLLGIDEEGTLRVDRASLRGAVRAVSTDFSGLTGRLSCDDFGDCAPGVQVIYHHTDSSVTDPGELSVAYRFEP
ncbi:MAG: branched-chain amino acid ABC transporter substrate-binding protein [Chloroflexota bacterium]|nr:branched-chain amino acid ABC transporter substrate-binding protein [Chloroflexota bacterium]MDE2885911.1 branched-chain amino acid ABC transporter substrate-binding protein [Chloroflexota bacterium]